jgi:hypothetical protein
MDECVFCLPKSGDCNAEIAKTQQKVLCRMKKQSACFPMKQADCCQGRLSGNLIT